MAGPDGHLTGVMANLLAPSDTARSADAETGKRVCKWFPRRSEAGTKSPVLAGRAKPPALRSVSDPLTLEQCA
jgi:hypothetical protein